MQMHASRYRKRNAPIACIEATGNRCRSGDQEHHRVTVIVKMPEFDGLISQISLRSGECLIVAVLSPHRGANSAP